jgi:sortase A
VFREGGSLFKVGIVMAALALVLVICATVVGFGLRGESGQAEAAKGSVGEALGSAFGSLFGGEASATRKPEGEVASGGSGKDPGEGPGEDDAAGYSSSGASGSPGRDSSSRSDGMGSNSRSEGQQARSEAGQGDQVLPAAENGDWPRPTAQEVQRANSPRQYHLVPGAVMGLTIDSIGIHDAPVFPSDGYNALVNGIAHVPGTSWPWSPTPQRNVYLAGHRMGYRGTWSRMLFYNLDKLQKGDEVVLRDRSGRSYEYRVSEIFQAEPTDAWVMGQVRGRDMVSLQTCTPLYTFEHRLIIRADRV